MEKVLWVTGGGSGMGAAAARYAAASGWRVALSGRRADALDEVAERISADGGEVLTLPLDVTDPEQVRAGHDAVVERFGRLDGLVLSAGLNTPRRDWADQSMEEFARVVDVNLTAVARVLDVALPQLRRTAGVVVVISSIAAWRTNPQAGVAYSASKAALAPLVASLNFEEAEHGVRACHLCPGYVATDFMKLRADVPDAAAQAEMLTADDVGRAVGFVLDAPPHVRIDELVISPVSQR
ncbi:SDR family oxidoreductase [Desertihabitans brevis]|uniref:SDR family oxidoreductase n=1 Tax=Desertihabitans brevis TaxID=2268447 RepID=UPI0018F5D71A|nr:SDR family oxidoreductase [Desertihabitans brevis]